MNQLRLITSLLTISDPPTNVLPQAIPKWKKSLLPQTQGNKILLLKRSDKVSSYQHHWGGKIFRIKLFHKEIEKEIHLI